MRDVVITVLLDLQVELQSVKQVHISVDANVFCSVNKMSKLSFRARALDASKPMPIYLGEELPDLPEYSAINRAVPQMPSGMEKEEECEHHLQRAICTGLIIPTPEVSRIQDLDFYDKCYPPTYRIPKQLIHMQPLWQEEETPEYDLDTEDEEWLLKQRHPDLTEQKFEEMIDRLEKSSGQTVVTLSEAKLLLERNDELGIAVYDYWLNKRLKTQHPLIPSVKTECRAGQSANNPYLAFRRRTEKMQTRKIRKNDESSYEKMVKLRRELMQANMLIEAMMQREKFKAELVRLTAEVARKRMLLGDYSGQIVSEIMQTVQTQPVRTPSFNAVALTSNTTNIRLSNYQHHYASRPPPALVPDQPRQREKRPYKRRKHRHNTPGIVTQTARDSGVYTSSSEEGTSAESATSHEDGPFAFKRKPGCFYEMPTSTLNGDPVSPEHAGAGVFYKHELDERHRFTLTSLNEPYQRCIGFARRRVGRGGRVILDRIATPLDDLWHSLPFPYTHSSQYNASRREEIDLETKVHRHPKEMTRDYHTGGKYPWRHAFRRHLSRKPSLWLEQSADSPRSRDYDTLPQQSDISLSEKRTINDATVNNLYDFIRKRTFSECSGDSFNSDDSLAPVEQTFEKYIDEVNKKWLHFRPKTPPSLVKAATPPRSPSRTELTPHTQFCVDMHMEQDTFTTAPMSLAELFPALEPDLDIKNEDLLTNLNLTDAQVDSLLSDSDIKSLNEDKNNLLKDELIDIVDPFLSQGQSAVGGLVDSGRCLKRRHASTIHYAGRTRVRVASPERSAILVDTPPAKKPSPNMPLRVREIKVEPKSETSAPNRNLVIDGSNDVPKIKIDALKRKDETAEEVQVAKSVQLKTVHTKHSPLKKHIITTTHRRSDVSMGSDVPQLVTVAVSDSLKLRLQNHILSTSSSGTTVVGLVQNGPTFNVSTPVAVAMPTVSSVTAVAREGTGSPARGRLPPVVLSVPHKPPVVMAPIPAHSAHGHKLKVLHSLAHTQRQILAQTRATGITQLPTVVSLSPINDAKSAPATALQIKTAPGPVAQFFEIKGGQLAKGPHLVNVVRQPQPGKTPTRLDFQDVKKRQVVTFDGTSLKGNVATAVRPQRVNVSLDGRQFIRASVPTVRGPIRQQIHLKNRTIVTSPQLVRAQGEGTASITIAGPNKASIPSAVMANLLQKKVHIPGQITQHLSRSQTETSAAITIATPKTSIPSAVMANFLHKKMQIPGQKIAISGAAAQTLAANVQAIAITTSQLKNRQARLITQPRAAPVAEIVEASTAPVAGPSSSLSADSPIEAVSDAGDTNGTVRRRQADSVPMEVT